MASKIETTFTGDTRSLERALAQMNGRIDTFEKKVGASQRRAAQSASNAWKNNNVETSIRNSLGLDNIDKSISGLGPKLARASAAFAAAFSAGEALNLADTMNRFTNSLKVAGLEGEKLATVQERLFEIASRNGTEIESLGQLYSRISQSAGELGASEQQILTVVEGVSAGLRIQGVSASAASGALLQLSQGLASGTFRAEEFNSVNEGARPILEAVANGSDRFNGSVATLRAEVLKGTVTSKEFFQALEKGSESLVTKAANAPLTVAQAMTNLQTSMIQYVGQVDQNLGATEKLAAALKLLSENLDLVGDSVVLIAIAMVSRLIPGMVAAGVASARLTAFQAAMSASMLGTSRAALVASASMATLNRAMAFFGGPWGLVIGAIAGAVYLLNKQNTDAAAATEALRSKIAQEVAALDDKEKAASDARVATGDMTDAELAALTATAQLTGRVDLLTTAYGRMALAAYEAARAAAAASLEEASTQRKSASRDRQRIEAAAQRRARGPVGSGDGGRGPAVPGLENVARGAARADPEVARARQAERDAMRLEDAERANAATVYRNGITGRIEGYAPPTTPTAPASGTRTGSRSSGGGTGPSGSEITTNSDRATTESSRRLADALAALADTAEQRHQNALQHIEWDAIDASNTINRQRAEGEITALAQQQALADTETTRAALAEAQMKKRALEIQEAAQVLEAERLDNQRAISELEAQYFSDMASLADTRGEREAFERQAFETHQRSERDRFEAEQTEIAARWKLAGMVQAEIDRRQNAAQTAFDRSQQTESAGFRRSQRETNNPFAQFARSTEDWNVALQAVAADGLNSLGDGITDAILRTKSLGEAFRDVSKQIIADLVRIAVQRKIVEPLANSLFGNSKSGSKGTSGTVSTVLQIVGSLFSKGRNAIGTNNFKGGLTMVGEGGPELAMLPGGTQIAPNGLLRNALATPRGQAGGTVVNLSTVVHANDSVVASEMRQYIQQANIQAVQAARQIVQQDQLKRSRNRVV